VDFWYPGVSSGTSIISGLASAGYPSVYEMSTEGGIGDLIRE